MGDANFLPQLFCLLFFLKKSGFAEQKGEVQKRSLFSFFFFSFEGKQAEKTKNIKVSSPASSFFSPCHIFRGSKRRGNTAPPDDDDDDVSRRKLFDPGDSSKGGGGEKTGWVGSARGWK